MVPPVWLSPACAQKLRLSRVRADRRRPCDLCPAGVSLVQQAFREHAAFVAKMAYRLTGRSDEVDDIVQDVFIVSEKSEDGGPIVTDSGDFAYVCDAAVH